MRIILQNQGNGLYLREGNQWTEKKNEAKNFSSVTEAEHYCQEHELNAVALALRGDSVYKLHLNCQKKKRVQAEQE